MNSDRDTLTGGLPHSETPGSPIARISPGLFAACHVLHRLSVPRHPPDALASRLITGIPVAGNTAPPPRTGPKPPLAAQLRAPALPAASHEDTSLGHAWRKLRWRHPRAPARPAPCRQAELCSADRRQAKLRFAERGLLGPGLSASVTSQLSLHPSIIDRHPPWAMPGRCFCFSERGATPLAAGRRAGCLSVQPRCTCRPAKPGFAGGGGERIRTDDLLLAKQALSQLSYTPVQESDVRS